MQLMSNRIVWLSNHSLMLCLIVSTICIGVDFQVKNLKVDSKTIALQLWDTAGQERLVLVFSNILCCFKANLLLEIYNTHLTFPKNHNSFLKFLKTSTVEKTHQL